MPRSPVTPKASRLLIMASICVVVAALYFAQDVLIPLALSVLICFLLAPVVKWLERYKLGRVTSVLIATIAALSIVGALGWVVTTQLLNLADNLPRYQANIVNHVNTLRGRGGTIEKITGRMNDLSEQLKKPTTAPTAASPATAPASQPSGLEGALARLDEYTRRYAVAASTQPSEPARGATEERPLFTKLVPDPDPAWRVLTQNAGMFLGPLGTAGLIVVFVIFMLLEREDLRDRFIRLITNQGNLTVTTQALDDAASRISRYLTAQAIVNATYGLAIGVGLWLIGLLLGHGTPFPSVFIWAILCAVLRFIPYIGPWIASAFPLAISFAVYSSYGPFFATAILFVVIELASNNIMEPKLYGSSTGMSAVAILVAAVFWTWLWGAAGLLLATPMTVCLVVIGKYVPQLAFLDILLGDEPVLDEPTRVYQRLLALDQEEAADLVTEYHKTHELAEVYDNVLLPALAMSEADRHRGRLDTEREQFIRTAMREMIDDLGEEHREKQQKAAAVEKERVAAEAKAAAETKGLPVREERTPVYLAHLPQGCSVNILTLPARDEADELAGLMLSQCLEFRGYCAFNLSASALAGEMLETVESKKADVVVVSALPPAAVTYSRYLCKRLHGRFDELNMLIGAWTIKGDLKRAKERIACSQAIDLVPTLQAALTQIYQLAQPVIVNSDAQAKEKQAESVVDAKQLPTPKPAANS